MKYELAEAYEYDDSPVRWCAVDVRTKDGAVVATAYASTRKEARRRAAIVRDALMADDQRKERKAER